MRSNLQGIYQRSSPNCQCSGMKFGGKCSCSYTKSLKARFNAITGVTIGGENAEEMEELLPSVEFSEGSIGLLCAEGDGNDNGDGERDDILHKPYLIPTESLMVQL